MTLEIYVSLRSPTPLLGLWLETFIVNRVKDGLKTPVERCRTNPCNAIERVKEMDMKTNYTNPTGLSWKTEI